MSLFTFWRRLLALAWMPIYLDSPDPRAAEANAEIGREALALSKQQYEDS